MSCVFFVEAVSEMFGCEVEGLDVTTQRGESEERTVPALFYLLQGLCFHMVTHYITHVSVF